MAEKVSVRGVDVKIRHPWLVFLWALVTLGIYYLVWYYKINRELRDYGRATGTRELGDSPLISLLAITLGWLIVIPPFVSMYRTFARIATAQHVAGLQREASPLVGLGLYLLALLVLPFELPYGQWQLNKVWRRELGAPETPTAAAEPPAEAPGPAAAPEEPAAPAGPTAAPGAPADQAGPTAAPEAPAEPSGPEAEPPGPEAPPERPPPETR